MSLWAKELETLTFEDVDDFCMTAQPEGLRLDYKVDMPAHLEKLMAAFGNTLGGMIILGVDSDAKTNTPIWNPPLKGMPMTRGLSETVNSKALEAVYPSLRIRQSPVIANKKLPGHAIIVVRIDESQNAPHAIEKNTSVYVRSDNRNQRFHLTNIDHLEYLLGRRKTITDKRQQILADAIDRAKRHLTQMAMPIEWVAISPLFPWKDFRSPEECYRFHQLNDLLGWHGARGKPQRFPGGSLLIALDHRTNMPLKVAASTVHSSGLLFQFNYSKCAIQERQQGGPPDDVSIKKATFQNSVLGFLNAAKAFYESCPELPGQLIVTIGVINALGVQLIVDSLNPTRKKFPDFEFKAEAMLDIQQLLKDPAEVAAPLFEELKFGFDG